MAKFTTFFTQDLTDYDGLSLASLQEVEPETFDKIIRITKAFRGFFQLERTHELFSIIPHCSELISKLWLSACSLPVNPTIDYIPEIQIEEALSALKKLRLTIVRTNENIRSLEGCVNAYIICGKEESKIIYKKTFLVYKDFLEEIAKANKEISITKRQLPKIINKLSSQSTRHQDESKKFEEELTIPLIYFNCDFTVLTRGGLWCQQEAEELKQSNLFLILGAIQEGREPEISFKKDIGENPLRLFSSKDFLGKKIPKNLFSTRGNVAESISGNHAGNKNESAKTKAPSKALKDKVIFKEPKVIQFGISDYFSKKNK